MFTGDHDVNSSKDPILAAILSGLIPGLGQIYCRRWARGAMFFIGTVLLGGLILPVGLIFSFGIWIWGIVDAYRIARVTTGLEPAGAGPVIDMDRISVPRIEMRQVVTYLLIPLGVAALFAVVVVFALMRYSQWGKSHSVNAVEPLISRIEAYKSERGAYPDRLQALIDPMDPIEKRQILDSWGRLYIYRRTGSSFELSSAGKDGIPQTEDDIPYHP